MDGAYETQERKDPNWKGERDCCEACVNWRPPAYVVATQCNGYVLNANGDCYLRSGTSVLRHDGGGVRVAYRVGLGPDPPPPPAPPHAVAGPAQRRPGDDCAQRAGADHRGRFPQLLLRRPQRARAARRVRPHRAAHHDGVLSLEGDHLRARAWARGGGDLAWLDQGVEGIGEFASAYSEATHACEQLSYRGCQGVVHRSLRGRHRALRAGAQRGRRPTSRAAAADDRLGPAGDPTEDPCAYNGGETADGAPCFKVPSSGSAATPLGARVRRWMPRWRSPRPPTRPLRQPT